MTARKTLPARAGEVLIWELKRHVLADGSGHFIQEDQPDLVVDAIRTIGDEARHGRTALA